MRSRSQRSPYFSTTAVDHTKWYRSSEYKEPKKIIKRMAQNGETAKMPGEAIEELLNIIRSYAPFDEAKVIKQLMDLKKTELSKLLNDWKDDENVIYKVI